MAAPTFNSDWSRLPAGTEIPELRTPTSHTYSNGDGSLTIRLFSDAFPVQHGNSATRLAPRPPDTSALPLTGTAGGLHYFFGDHGGWYFMRTQNIGYSGEFSHPDADRGYAKFPVPAFIGDLSIVGVALHYDQYYSDTPTTVLTHLTTDPVTSPDQDLWNSIEAGYPITDTETNDLVGWVERPFTQTGVDLLRQSVPAGWFAWGFKRVSGDGDAYSAGAYLDVVFLTPDEPEIQALRAELPTYPVVAHGSDTAQLVLANHGLHSSGQFWAYATAPGLDVESTLVSNIDVSETVSVALRLPATSKADTFVSYRLWSACPTDPWPLDDTTQLNCWVFPTGTYAGEGFDQSGFPPSGWAVVNNDGGYEHWQWRADDGMSHSGVGFTMCVHEQDRPNDDWLIGGPVYPKQGDPDSLGFFYRIYQTTPALCLQVWAMRGPTIADRVLDLDSVSASDTVYHRLAVSLDRFDGDTIYVGFRFLGRGDWNGFCLDDIWFSRYHVPGKQEPRAATVAKQELALEPNPTAGRFVTVRCSLAVGRMRRLTIRDVAGRTVRTFALDPSGITQLDLRGLPPGVYLATLQGSVPLVSRKLVLAAP
ncbi:MAG TPA: choice-of-anchor J domain-containing protein [bacterium]|nr:choice-of-anchor J domain-containing protein [bacterium]